MKIHHLEAAAQRAGMAGFGEARAGVHEGARGVGPEREVRVARWLTSCGLPVERPFDVVQPDASCALPVTFWHAVDGQWTTPDRLAEILRELHDLVPPAYLGLPLLDPFARMRQRLAGSPDLDIEVRNELEAMIAQQETELPAALAGREEVILFDLERFCLRPRIWDLITMAVYRDLGWHTEAEYAAFCAAYGENPSDDPAFPAVAAVQRLRMVCWLAQRTGDDPVIAEEFAMRLADLRDPDRPRRWNPY